MRPNIAYKAGDAWRRPCELQQFGLAPAHPGLYTIARVWPPTSQLAPVSYRKGQKALKLGWFEHSFALVKSPLLIFGFQGD